MKKNEIETSQKKVCDLTSLSEMMLGKKHLILDIIDSFLKQAPEELLNIELAVQNGDFPKIKNSAHTMKSSVLIMGISSLSPVLSEIESLGGLATGITKIEELNSRLKLICKSAIEELENERVSYL